MIAGRPEAAEIPRAIAIWADGRRLEAIWENELGGLTFRAGAGATAQFVKWSPHSSDIDLGEEIRRLRWAGSFTLVPRVLDQEADTEGSWFSTAGISGLSAVDEQWITRPDVAVTAIGAGLRRFHEDLPVEGCPFSWSATDRLADAQTSAAAGLFEPGDWNPDHQQLTVNQALDILAEQPPVDRVVVCHGDACAPNTLLAADGSPLAHVDLGSLGVADRWADLAIATWSTTWNYGPGWENLLLDAYGIDPDPARTAYYRLLWDLS